MIGFLLSAIMDPEQERDPRAFYPEFYPQVHRDYDAIMVNFDDLVFENPDTIGIDRIGEYLNQSDDQYTCLILRGITNLSTIWLRSVMALLRTIPRFIQIVVCNIMCRTETLAKFFEVDYPEQLTLLIIEGCVFESQEAIDNFSSKLVNNYSSQFTVISEDHLITED